MINFIKINILILIFFQNLNAQTFFSSNPNDILYLEQKSTLDSSYSNNLMVRPILNPSINNEWSLLARAELYFNTNYPNFENMGNRYIGKGFGAFNSLNLSYHGKFLSFSIEPFYIYNQNKNNNLIEKDGMFARLNDAGYNIASPYESIGLRETQLYLHYKSLAIGYSNANMWWGPGIHNTLTMTNNTSGFSHLMIGTINEKRFKNLGFNIRYVFSTLDKTIGNPYFTGLVWNFKIYSNPIISFGLIRNYLSGGLPTDRPFTKSDAALIVFEQLLIDTKIKEYPPDWDPHDPWDELMSGFLMMDFPSSRLRIYAEFGTNDHRQNFSDLRTHPDHSSAYILGLRKYGIFNNKFLLGGFEYTNIVLGKFWKYRATPNWYDKEYYDYSSYDGRRWAAHSGSDSDDFYFYFGYQNQKLAFIPSFNYERHGVLFSRFPEVKMEIRFDIRYAWNDYKFNIYIEREYIEHAGFIPNKWRNGTVIWFGIERDITKAFSNKLGLVKN